EPRGAVLEAHGRRARARAGGGPGPVTGTTVQPSLWHVLQPKWRTVRQRLREARERGGWGRLTILLTAGGLFWLGVYGVLFRILKYFRGVEDLGPLLAGKLLGLVLLAFVSILILSNIITALSSFFLAKDLDLLVSAPVDWLRLYLAKLWETVIHSSWMVALMIVPILAAFGVIYGGGVLFLPFAVLTIVPMLILPGVVGAALTLILVNVFPARRTRDLLSIIAVGALLHRELFATGFTKAQEGAERFVRGTLWRRTVGSLLKPLTVAKREFVLKDIKLFFRDTTQWSQLILLAVLVVVYVFNIKALPLHRGEPVGFFYVNLVSFLNLGLAGFVLASIAARFIFPAVSLEGRQMWLLRSS